MLPLKFAWKTTGLFFTLLLAGYGHGYTAVLLTFFLL